MVEKQQIDIKQISIRQVGAVKTILAKSGFTFENVKEDSTKDGYTTYGTFKTPSAIIVVRLSNHICSMKNWTERYKPKLIAKPKLLRRMGKNIQDPYKERSFFSIVFKAFDYFVNDSGSWKAICNEYVFNPIEVEEGGTIGKIANDAKGLNRGKPSTINGIQPQIREVNNENENLPKATDKIPQNISVDKDGNWVSTNGWGADYVSENKQYNTNRNMKQTIKLKESELKRLIAESVKGVINELDWKTYQNAAKKAHLKSLDNYGYGQPNYDENKSSEYIRKSSNFSKAAEDAFNKEYGYDDGRYHLGLNSRRQGSSTIAPGGGTFPYYDVSDISAGDRNDTYKWGGRTIEKGLPLKYDFHRNTTPKNVVDKFDSANDELDNYKRGNYEYIKGKGWQMKESINRRIDRIVSESIRRNIR